VDCVLLSVYQIGMKLLDYFKVVFYNVFQVIISKFINLDLFFFEKINNTLFLCSFVRILKAVLTDTVVL
jgi:hypothetical protein